jgi:hypothetical protein
MQEYAIKAMLRGTSNPYLRIKQHVMRSNIRDVEKARYAVYIIDTARRLGLLTKEV